MNGRAQTPEQKRAVIDRILAAWEQHPHQRLGQLVVNVLRGGDGDQTTRRIFYVEDAVLVEALEKWEPR